jgi:hypothetical protein
MSTCKSFSAMGGALCSIEIADFVGLDAYKNVTVEVPH